MLRGRTTGGGKSSNSQGVSKLAQVIPRGEFIRVEEDSTLIRVMAAITVGELAVTSAAKDGYLLTLHPWCASLFSRLRRGCRSSWEVVVSEADVDRQGYACS